MGSNQEKKLEVENLVTHALLNKCGQNWVIFRYYCVDMRLVLCLKLHAKSPHPILDIYILVW